MQMCIINIGIVSFSFTIIDNHHLNMYKKFIYIFVFVFKPVFVTMILLVRFPLLLFAIHFLVMN